MGKVISFKENIRNWLNTNWIVVEIQGNESLYLRNLGKKQPLAGPFYISLMNYRG